ncbi:protein O-mannosyl-transferase TMTC2 [Patella vulgata]|uniref:protein O-mannosyl-transferase TMTC2 n=1 Tax=Patella vulgata TaxID=6465 RepID=UPI0021802E64|nr:protein O-mannosyl-transferase TMTC2 [Patella vulgata]
MDYTILAASFLALGLYSNTLPADFAYDDSRAILKNPDLLPETPLINLFYDDFWGTPLTHSGSHKSYRPLCVLTFRLNYYLGKLEPWGYHLGNVILHSLVTAVFTFLAKKFLKHWFPTLVAGCLFASHPIHTEAVAGIVGRADEGACLFFILTFLNYIKYTEYRDTNDEGKMRKRWLYMAGVYMFTTAGMLTKEQAITVLGVCLSFDMFIVHRVKITDIISLKILKLSRLLEGGVLLTVYGVILVILRIYFMGNKPPEFAPSDNPASDSSSILTRTLTYNLLPAYNVWILICPRVLSFDWSMESIPLVQTVTDPRNMWTILLYSLLLYIAYKILKDLHKNTTSAIPIPKPHTNGNGVGHHSSSSTKLNNSNKIRLKRRGSNSSTDSYEDVPVLTHSLTSVDILIISLSIIIFPFIPASNTFFYVGFVIAERILYIPSMGFCLLVAHGSFILYKKCSQHWQKTLMVVSLISTVILFSSKTFLRNQDWQTEERLYKSGIAVNPPKAWGNLANIWNGQRKSAEAEDAYRNALKYRGNMADVHYNLGILLQEQKRYDEAIDSYNKAKHFRPKLSMAYLNLGIILSQLGQSDEAEKIYKICADLDTSGLKDPRLHEGTKISCLYNLGRLYTEQEKLKEAVDTYHEALKRRPNHYAPQSLYNMLGEAYVKMNLLDEGAKWFNEALKAKPDHIPAHLTMGKLLQKKKQISEAEQWFEKALKIDENDVSVLHHYAQFLVEIGKDKESAVMYRKAISKSTDDFELLFNAANVFRQIGNNLDAEEMYRKAVKIKPNVPTAHMNLGAMLHTNEKFQEAELSYLEALRLKPDDALTKTNLQKLRNRMNQKGTASTIDQQ